MNKIKIYLFLTKGSILLSSIVTVCQKTLWSREKISWGFIC
jgi:hypothetical protein